MIRSEKLKELKSLISELKVVQRKEIESENKFITNKAYNCKLNNGKSIIREQILKGGLNGSAALIVPITREGNIILTVEPRVFTKRTVGISIPSGYINLHERPIEAAKRELLEETGYTPNEMTYLGGFYQDMGISSAYNYAFLAKQVEKVGKQKLDKDEFIRYFICTFDEALELINMGYIEGCNAIISIKKAEKLLRKGKLWKNLM